MTAELVIEALIPLLFIGVWLSIAFLTYAASRWFDDE